jgi:hypothetical protein
MRNLPKRIHLKAKVEGAGILTISILRLNQYLKITAYPTENNNKDSGKQEPSLIILTTKRTTQKGSHSVGKCTFGRVQKANAEVTIGSVMSVRLSASDNSTPITSTRVTTDTTEFN